MPRTPVSVPENLGWWRSVAGGGAWLERLPGLVAESVESWSLDLGPPYAHAHVSFVAPVLLEDGTPAVLKINFPDVESEQEAGALEHWAGEGAVRLLAHDPERRALLVERCEPGTTLWEVEDEEEANLVAARLLRRLWRPPRPGNEFRSLEAEAARWADELPRRWQAQGRPFERRLLDEAVAFLRAAGPAQRDRVVLHQDFHGGNVLRAGREPWLAIDPKPLVGEREFDTASLLRDRRQELGRDSHPGLTIRRRLDQLAAELDLDRVRMRGWGVAHALAWDPDEAMIACARWLADAR